MHPFDDNLIFEGRLSLKWTVLNSDEDRAECARMQESNDDVLAALVTLDEHIKELPADNPTLVQEIRRLDSKLDIVLNLLEKIITSTTESSNFDVKFNAGGLQWQVRTDNELSSGQELCVEICLNQKLPWSLVVSGKIDKIEKLEGGKLVIFKIDELPEATRDSLDKFIFRTHRRNVARKRHLQSDSKTR